MSDYEISGAETNGTAVYAAIRYIKRNGRCLVCGALKSFKILTCAFQL